ncbi:MULTISPECIES: DNA repair protein RadC [unclassified Kaistella]|uniref:RadC family protein n=1 Tax=unclassified Kaistella TaxID=2762626 RepID=UPI0027349ECB|nr:MULTISPECIES: DNA repair protein RadC [unclassified Kaistella]MCZ2085886.1 DNA repair protein RadC [Flavobacteriales bacterium]MDP2453973.1 DNA repair protein RadC [Kaistella sp. SH11-4b]MDP2457030.1 DNA repair protein RadC [Kaistella sp. SH40-3]MDP2459787.1 DNA repair protein RadC [Kaistella sp. SH19-2b]
MSIKFLAEDDRPREKFLLKGKNSLSDAELLAIIMGSGNREDSAVELARKILNSVGNNWHNLSLLQISDLMKFKGIGEAKAISIAAALEIGRRRAAQEVPEKVQITSSQESYKVLLPYLSDLQTEEFWAIYLNQNNRILGKGKLSSGGINQSVVDVRILFKTALEHFATGIVIAHNHPSGNLKPSNEDLKITKQITEAGKILNIQLLDHLIIAQNSYLSFADENLL